jgi:hypothetical protein
MAACVQLARCSSCSVAVQAAGLPRDSQLQRAWLFTCMKACMSELGFPCIGGTAASCLVAGVL